MKVPGGSLGSDGRNPPSLHSPLPGRTEIQDRAAPAGRILEEAAALAVQHHDLVVVIDRLSIPLLGQQGSEPRMGWPHGRGLRDQPGALSDSMVVAVDGKGRLSEHRERQHRRACLRSDSRNALKPRPRLLHGHVLEEIQRQRAMPLLNRMEHGLKPRRLLLGQVTPWIVASTWSVGAFMSARQSA